MTAIQHSHRSLRFYHLFLAFVGVVLLGLNSWVMSENAKEHKRQQGTTGKPVLVNHGGMAAILIPCFGIFIMYLLLAVGRPRRGPSSPPQPNFPFRLLRGVCPGSHYRSPPLLAVGQHPIWPPV